jgi:hypothetical protein
MIDVNYLGHNFIRYWEYGVDRDYQCTKCKVKIDYREIIGIKNEYCVIDVNANGIAVISANKLLSCNECIIKNIIE